MDIKVHERADTTFASKDAYVTMSLDYAELDNLWRIVAAAIRWDSGPDPDDSPKKAEMFLREVLTQALDMAKKRTIRVPEDIRAEDNCPLKYTAAEMAARRSFGMQ